MTTDVRAKVLGYVHEHSRVSTLDVVMALEQQGVPADEVSATLAKAVVEGDVSLDDDFRLEAVEVQPV
jgi:hypothetical protein